MKKFLVLFFLFSICFVSCTGDDDDDGVSVGGGSGPCKGVICSGHGTCYEIGDNLVSCNCEEGYVAEGIDCVLDDGTGNGTDTGSDPCAGVTCSGHGNCYDKDGKPACNCEQGYDAQGTNCVEEGSSDPCAGKDCNNQGTCNSNTGLCECEEGWLGDNCESFDNGGPWTVTVTGDVNEEITFNKLLCGERPLQNNKYKNEFYITFYTSANNPHPSFFISLDTDYLNSGTFNKDNSYLITHLNLDSNRHYGSSDDGAQIYFDLYESKVKAKGEVTINGLLSNDGKKIFFDKKNFSFKCPCIRDDNNPNDCGRQ